ncbi:hypothetical protein KSS87_015023, partial [Heliosperma pusillum]
AELETVIPQIGGRVRIVNGAYRGSNAKLLAINMDKFCAKVQIEKGVYDGRIIPAVEKNSWVIHSEELFEDVGSSSELEDSACSTVSVTVTIWEGETAAELLMIPPELMLSVAGIKINLESIILSGQSFDEFMRGRVLLFDVRGNRQGDCDF